MRTTDITTDMNVNEPCEAYLAPQVEVIEMEAENIIATSPGAGDNGDPDVGDPSPNKAPRFWDI